MGQLSDFDPKGKKFLAIAAHADDIDFFAGGTLLRWIGAGAKGALVIATNGDKGASDRKVSSLQLSKTRQAEQMAASNFLGLSNTWFLGLPDAHLEVTQELKKSLVKIIRESTPDIVLTWDPALIYSTENNQINHPDHRVIGQAALDAIYPLARDRLTFPDQVDQGLEPHNVSDVFLFNSKEPNFFSDISTIFDKKLELLRQHKSQVTDGKLVEEMKNWNAKVGQKCAVPYAEEFTHLELK